ncbi:hypothetical protein RZS08_27960, partial [Arthrospira platensis SPKY1]|nr:hypothetical protein [Arthrospira platensis SPKY1]
GGLRPDAVYGVYHHVRRAREEGRVALFVREHGQRLDPARRVDVRDARRRGLDLLPVQGRTQRGELAVQVARPDLVEIHQAKTPDPRAREGLEGERAHRAEPDDQYQRLVEFLHGLPAEEQFVAREGGIGRHGFIPRRSRAALA